MNQKKIVDLQEIVIDTKKEHVEAIKATVTTEIKSYFDMVEQNDSFSAIAVCAVFATLYPFWDGREIRKLLRFKGM